MKRIYLVRHGQTNANVNHTCQGPDENLSDEGRLQAIRVAERTQHLDYDKMFISDYVRTQQTAEPIIKLKDVHYVLTPLLREEQFPDSWIGESEKDEERKQFAEDLIEKADDENWRVDGAENTTDICNRIEATLEMLKEDESDNILVVSHGSFLKQLIGYVLLDGKGTKKEVASFKRTLKTTNTGISILVFDKNRWRVLSWNDHAHFAE